MAPTLAFPAHPRRSLSITRAPRARDVSLWSAVFIYAMFLAVLAIIVGSLAPPGNLEWSIPSEARHNFH